MDKDSSYWNGAVKLSWRLTDWADEKGHAEATADIDFRSKSSAIRSGCTTDFD